MLRYYLRKRAHIQVFRTCSFSSFRIHFTTMLEYFEFFFKKFILHNHLSCYINSTENYESKNFAEICSKFSKQLVSNLTFPKFNVLKNELRHRLCPALLSNFLRGFLRTPKTCYVSYYNHKSC